MVRFGSIIACVVALTVFAALGLAAIWDVFGIWIGLLYTLVMAAVCVAILGAFCLPGKHKLPWVGFAVFGFVYLSQSKYCNSPTGVYDPVPTTAIIDNFIAALNVKVIKLEFNNYDEEIKKDIVTTTGEVFVVTKGGTISIAPFRQIGHMVLTILFAIVGAFFGRLLQRYGGRHSN